MVNVIIIVAYPPRFLYEMFNIKVDEIIIISSLYLPCKRNNHSLISYSFSICSHGGWKKTCLTWTWSGGDGCEPSQLCEEVHLFPMIHCTNQPKPTTCILSSFSFSSPGGRKKIHLTWPRWGGNGGWSSRLQTFAITIYFCLPRLLF